MCFKVQEVGLGEDLALQLNRQAGSCTISGQCNFSFQNVSAIDANAFPCGGEVSYSSAQLCVALSSPTFPAGRSDPNLNRLVLLVCSVFSGNPLVELPDDFLAGCVGVTQMYDARAAFRRLRSTRP